MTIYNKFLNNSLKALIYLMPLSFIFGNVIINVFVILIGLLGLMYYKKNIFLWQTNLNLMICMLFFVLLLFSTYYNFIFIEQNKDAFKALKYIRFLIFLLVIRKLIIDEVINIKLFLCSCLLISFLISTDIIFQYFFGKNITGNGVIEFSRGVKYYTGIFGKELIAGGFILMFSTLGIFSIFYIFNLNKKIYYIVIFALLTIFFLSSLILAGNRMPVVMFMVFLVSFSILYKKKEKLYYFLFSILSAALLSIIVIKSETLIKRASNFYIGIPNPLIIAEELKKQYPNLEKYKNSGRQFHTLKEFKTTSNYKEYPFFTGHLPIYITSVDLFLDKPFFGGGIKSFRNNCIKKVHLPNRVCESHPHNYVLEILNDTGLIGFLLLFFLVINLLINNYKDYRNNEKSKIQISNWIYLAIILSIFISFFPFKSSGSFFSTFNSSFVFMILGISLGLNDKKFNKR